MTHDQMNLYFYLLSNGPWIQGNNYNWLFLNSDTNNSTTVVGLVLIIWLI